MKNIFFVCTGLLLTQVALTQGNVGIGTTTPVAKLDVIGSIKITDGTQGDGKVLTSDGNGKGSWQAVTISSSDPNAGYPVISIGCNTWMTKNLDVSTYRNGDTIPLVTNAESWAAQTSGAYCYYNFNAANGAVYGKLYNWYAVNDPKGLAPEGWHIPSDFEWTTLINTLGGSNIAGGMMKAQGTSYWNPPNLGATNLCNFSALPGGSCNLAGTFSGEGNIANWWSSTKGETNIAWSRNLNYNDTKISGAGTDLRFGYSVRCIKD